MLNISERVLAGAMLLDEHHPGWEGKINLPTLNIHNCRRCALGQLYGDFEKGQKALGLQDAQTVAELGFFALEEFSADRNPEAIAEEYSALTKEWRRAAGNRRITRETCAA